MSSMTVPDECNPKATFLLLNPWGPFRSYVNQRVSSPPFQRLPYDSGFLPSQIVAIPGNTTLAATFSNPTSSIIRT